MDYVIFSKGGDHCIRVRLGYIVSLKNIVSIGKMKLSSNIGSKRRNKKSKFYMRYDLC